MTKIFPLRSATYPWINFSALTLFFAVFLLIWPETWTKEQQTWLAMGLVFAAIAGLELLRLYITKEKLPAWQVTGKFDLNTTLTKCLGMVATYIAVGLYYWVFPIYGTPYYIPFISLLTQTMPTIIILGFAYIAIMDLLFGSTRDSYYELGALIGGMREERNWTIIQQHFMGWLVKVFFLPLMYLALIDNIQETRQLYHRLTLDFMSVYFFLYGASYLVDLLFVSIGYICTFKATDSHIRTSEPTFFGWGIAIICYQPFWSLIYEQYLAYNDYGWDLWLKNYPVLLWVWGIAILFCVIIYAWASICFGIRFSNLTYRGLIAHGPYRFTKHPAYLSKNISWWLISVPFIANTTVETALKQCVMLLIINLIYYLRAFTEERHLSRYAEYREYLRYMDKHDITRRVPKFALLQRSIARHA